MSLIIEGIRPAAYELNEQYPQTQPMERAVFLSHGEQGHMVPNQYWVPGMGVLCPLWVNIMSFTAAVIQRPMNWGVNNVERMVYELINDNCGVCRFHRQWSEPLLDEILNDRFGLNQDFKSHHYQLAQENNDHERGKSIPWETERMTELFFNYLEYCGDSGSEDPSIFRWQNHEDNLMTAQAFWQAIRDGQEIAFRAGADNIHDSLTPAQYKNKLLTSE